MMTILSGKDSDRHSDTLCPSQWPSANASMDEQRYSNCFCDAATILCSLAQMVIKHAAFSWELTLLDNLIPQSDYTLLFFHVNTFTEMEIHRNALRLPQLT